MGACCQDRAATPGIPSITYPARRLCCAGISDDFRRLLESDNFSLREVKRIAKDDMRRRWALRERQERLLQQQESAIREHVQKITLSMVGGDLAALLGGGGAKAEEVRALQARAAAVEEALQGVRQDQRRILNNMESAAADTDGKIEAEARRAAAEFNIYRSQVAVRFNDSKEALTALQAEVRAQVEAEQRRVTHLEDRLRLVDRRLDGEQSKIDPLAAKQRRMQTLLEDLAGALGGTDKQVLELGGKIERATAASLNTVESNQRLERALTENAEYYDVELRFMRTHVAETVAAVDQLRGEKAAFVSGVERQVRAMTNDLNSFVERLPSGSELFAMCQDYEQLWVRLHYEGAGGSEELSKLSDALHTKVSQAALRVAHHVATGADRLVLARWTAAYTGKRAAANPQDAPAARSGGPAATRHRRSLLADEERPETVADTTTETAPGTAPEFLGLGRQVEAAWDTPSVDLVEQVREELLQSYLAESLVALLRAADEANGPPGLLKSTGRAAFQRKLKKAIDAALTKYPVMVDPAQTSYGASLSLGRLSRKHQAQTVPVGTARHGSATVQAAQQHGLAAECDTCASCGHELAEVARTDARTAAPSALLPVRARPSSASSVAVSSSNAARRAYPYPSNLAGETRDLVRGLTVTTLTAGTEYSYLATTAEMRDGEPRPESPVSPMSVTVSRRSPVSFAREPPDWPAEADSGAALQTNAGPMSAGTNFFPALRAGDEAAAAAAAAMAARPLHASASGSTRHREAVKLAQSQSHTTLSAQQHSLQTQTVNLRTAGRETGSILASVQGSTARVGAGFEVPVIASQQSSAQLASQLAGRFRQDASFQGSDVRKVDAGELLGPLQSSRKIFGAHGKR
jgi:hypothetical protein